MRQIFRIWREVGRRFGFQEVEAPVLERLALYEAKSGPEIAEQVYQIKSDSRRLVLRPELTPSLIRMVNQRGPALKRPMKWFSIGRFWRRERQQRGRLREFYQLNMDIFGEAGVQADAEVVAATVEILRRLGLTRQTVVLINDRRLVVERLRQVGVGEEELLPVLRAMDRFAREGRGGVTRALDRISLRSDQEQEVLDILEGWSLEELAASGSQELRAAVEPFLELFELLEAYEVASHCRFDSGVVRGLDYYTGFVFEVHSTRERLRALAGGGRYDQLAKELGGEPLPAVGIAMGDVVLAGVLPPDRRGVGENLDVYIAYLGGHRERQIALLLAQDQRRRGKHVDLSLRPQGLSKQLDYANTRGAPVVLIVGPEDLNRGEITEKEMASGRQRTLPLREVFRSKRRAERARRLAAMVE